MAGIRNGAENAHRGGSKNASGRKIKKKCREFIVSLRYNRGYTNQIYANSVRADAEITMAERIEEKKQNIETENQNEEKEQENANEL